MSPNFKNTSTCQTSLPRAYCKKKDAKKAKPKRTPRIFMPLRRQQNSAEGINLGGKINKAQVKHLQN